MSETVLMPDGTPFPFWDDRTAYARVYHVAQGHPDASDDGPGSEDRPFATIGRAAAILEPGEKAVIHEGVYRECVRPVRGGEGPDRMIAYEAAPGEHVEVRGSRLWQPEAEPSRGWRLTGRAGGQYEPNPEGHPVWMAAMPADWFPGYNPFLVNNFSTEFTSFTSDWSKEETHRFLLKRGQVIADGVPLRQVRLPRELLDTDGAWWPDPSGLVLHVRLPGDADPAGVTLEVTVQEQLFVPRAMYLGYVRVSGLHFLHAADGLPVPQRAAVSAWRGHHWIVEDCTIRHVNATGLDLGEESWHADRRPAGTGEGGHIVRRCTLSAIGVCGMAAVRNNTATLVEDCLVERVGGLALERLWETGGLKFHHADHCLIRRNVFRHLRDAPGVWLDYLNHESRVTGNVFADIEGILGGCYIEVSQAPNAVDGNLFWDIRGTGIPADRDYAGPGANVDSGEKCLVARNLFGRVRDHYAVACHLTQKDRRVAGRYGLCRQHRILGNVFAETPRRILLSRVADNASDGNLFDARDAWMSHLVEFPEPRAMLTLEAWQEYMGLDAASREATLSMDFDPETLRLTVEVEGEMPVAPALEALGVAAGPPGPEALGLKAGRTEYVWQAGPPAGA